MHYDRIGHKVLVLIKYCLLVVRFLNAVTVRVRGCCRWPAVAVSGGAAGAAGGGRPAAEPGAPAAARREARAREGC